MEFAGRRAEEKETSALQTQEKFSAIFDSLRADQEKVCVCVCACVVCVCVWCVCV